MTAEHFTSIDSSAKGISQLLDLAVRANHFEGAYVYRSAAKSTDAYLVAFTGAPVLPAAISGPARHLSGNSSVVALHARAAEDPRFAALPEFRANAFEGVVSIPLLDSTEPVGFANFCRKARAPITADSVRFLTRLSDPLGELLMGAALRQQLEKANRDLADRKVVERAKGLLQEQFRISEEEAYLRIRRVSRQRRTAMREIALRVIESRGAWF